ncbi:MAG: histidine kinase [Pseudomonadota bacterium]|nr:histidine kinase [Pseudomonadota bacterium]
MFHSPLQSVRQRRFSDWPLAVKSILGFWLFYALTVLARALLSSDPGTIVQNKLITLGFGIILTGLIYAAVATFSPGPSIRRKAMVAGIGCFIAAWAMAGLLLLAEKGMRDSQEKFRFQAREGFVVVGQGQTVRVERAASEPLVLTLPRVGELDGQRRFRVVADTAVIWLFFFAAWASFYIARLAQAEALGARQRATEAESAARAAQVRALRYQVNPHFLFNTLNSLSSLIMASRNAEAETMILKLSNFFRSSLSLDASADVSLAEEIELQRLYLDIEKVRFPRRLKVAIDVPADLETARLPALILQPVVENAIKYGVSTTREKVELRITAREAGPERFTIEVVNGAGSALRKSAAAPPEGTGVGLVNVSERLNARFGPAAQCEFGPLGDGGYRVIMTLPLVRTNG